MTEEKVAGPVKSYLPFADLTGLTPEQSAFQRTHPAARRQILDDLKGGNYQRWLSLARIHQIQSHVDFLRGKEGRRSPYTHPSKQQPWGNMAQNAAGTTMMMPRAAGEAVHLSISPERVACGSGGAGTKVKSTPNTNEVTCGSCRRTMNLGLRDGTVEGVPGKPGKWRRISSAADLTIKDYDGREGNNSHITRNEQGMIPVDWVRNMHGARGELPGQHRNAEGDEWEEFKQHVAAGTPGYSSPVFIVVEHGKEPLLYEGNHRRDAYVENGATHVPAEIRYFGHAERQGTVGERAMRRTAAIADEAGLKAAGIAVIAMDTGRVLMQQRALNPLTCPCGMGVTWDESNGYQHDDGSVSHDNEFYGQSVSDLLDQGHPQEDDSDSGEEGLDSEEGLDKTSALEFDPNEGTWEFPGGKLDPGESARNAATREFREEVGQDLPPGVFVGAWVSPGGLVAISMQPGDQTYGFQDLSGHTAPSDRSYAVPLHDVDSMMPGFYDGHHQDYSHGNDGDAESISKILGAHNQPDKKIRIYRAVPHGISKIYGRQELQQMFPEHDPDNLAEWVGISKDYALEHAHSNSCPKCGGNLQVITGIAKAKDLLNEGYPTEWGYVGDATLEHSGTNRIYKGKCPAPRWKPKSNEQLEDEYDQVKHLGLEAVQQWEQENERDRMYRLRPRRRRANYIPGSADVDPLAGLVDDPNEMYGISGEYIVPGRGGDTMGQRVADYQAQPSRADLNWLNTDGRRMGWERVTHFGEGSHFYERKLPDGAMHMLTWSPLSGTWGGEAVDQTGRSFFGSQVPSYPSAVAAHAGLNAVERAGKKERTREDARTNQVEEARWDYNPSATFEDWATPQSAAHDLMQRFNAVGVEPPEDHTLALISSGWVPKQEGAHPLAPDFTKTSPATGLYHNVSWNASTGKWMYDATVPHWDNVEFRETRRSVNPDDPRRTLGGRGNIPLDDPDAVNKEHRRLERSYLLGSQHGEPGIAHMFNDRSGSPYDDPHPDIAAVTQRSEPAFERLREGDPLKGTHPQPDVRYKDYGPIPAPGEKWIEGLHDMSLLEEPPHMNPFGGLEKLNAYEPELSEDEPHRNDTAGFRAAGWEFTGKDQPDDWDDEEPLHWSYRKTHNEPGRYGLESHVEWMRMGENEGKPVNQWVMTTFHPNNPEHSVSSPIEQRPGNAAEMADDHAHFQANDLGYRRPQDSATPPRTEESVAHQWPGHDSAGGSYYPRNRGSLQNLLRVLKEGPSSSGYISPDDADSDLFDQRRTLGWGDADWLNPESPMRRLNATTGDFDDDYWSRFDHPPEYATLVGKGWDASDSGDRETIYTKDLPEGHSLTLWKRPNPNTGSMWWTMSDSTQPHNPEQGQYRGSWHPTLDHALETARSRGHNVDTHEEHPEVPMTAEEQAEMEAQEAEWAQRRAERGEPREGGDEYRSGPGGRTAATKAPVYKGFIYLIQNERDIDLTAREHANPDDPDGDMTEQSAWWDIEHARKNPALRKECKKGTPWAELELWADKSVRTNKAIKEAFTKLAGKCSYCKSPATKEIKHSEGMGLTAVCDKHLDKGKTDAEHCTPDGTRDPSNIVWIHEAASKEPKDVQEFNPESALKDVPREPVRPGDPGAGEPWWVYEPVKKEAMPLTQDVPRVNKVLRSGERPQDNETYDEGARVHDVTLPSGDWIAKTPQFRHLNDPDYQQDPDDPIYFMERAAEGADLEEFASRFGRAISDPDEESIAPEAIRGNKASDPSPTVYVRKYPDFEDLEDDWDRDDHVKTPRGKVIGLFHAVMGEGDHVDHHNMGVTGSLHDFDKKIPVSIDHTHSSLPYYAQTLAAKKSDPDYDPGEDKRARWHHEFGISPYAAHFLGSDATGWGARKAKNPLAPGDAERVHGALESMRPWARERGREDWVDAAQRRVKMLGAKAAGTETMFPYKMPHEAEDQWSVQHSASVEKDSTAPAWWVYA